MICTQRGGGVCTNSSIQIAKIVKGGITSTNQLFVDGGPPLGEMYVIQAKPMPEAREKIIVLKQDNFLFFEKIIENTDFPP